MGDAEPRTWAAMDGEGPVVAFLRLLADAPDGDAVAAAIARGLLAPWSPDLVSIYLVDPDGTALVQVARFASGAVVPQHYRRLPLELSLPLTDVFRAGEEGIWRVGDLIEAFPVLAGWAAGRHVGDAAELLGMPVRTGGQTVGVLVVSFPTGIERTWRSRTLLDGGVSAVGLWARGPLASGAVTSKRRTEGSGVELTDRQRRVLALVRAGRTNPQIAADLTVSVGTVKADLTHLFRVFDVPDRADLAVVAERAGY